MTQLKGFPLRSTREALIEHLQQNELRMRTQIRNLELERETLRYRLESLRKAKSIMVAPKQSSNRRVVSETSTVQPQHSVGDGSSVQLQHNQHEAEINHLRVESAAKQKAIGGLEAEVQLLRGENSKLMDKVAELITANDALRACNAALENNCKGLMEELSIKEAQWSERRRKPEARDTEAMG
ncbi:hypothetical protein EMCRGX_G011061 [Ephydatia muelleri]